MTAIEEVKVQSKLQPGTEGWWPVWGASAKDIRAGDVIFVQGDEDWTEISGHFLAKASPLRIGLIAADGTKFSVGALCPVVVLRRGTHNTLA